MSRPIRCEACFGSGNYEPDGRGSIRCPGCKGTGRVWVDDTQQSQSDSVFLIVYANGTHHQEVYEARELAEEDAGADDSIVEYVPKVVAG